MTEYSWTLTEEERHFSQMMQHWVMQARTLALKEGRDPNAPKGAGKSVHCQQGLRRDLRAATGRRTTPAAAAASATVEESPEQPWSTEGTDPHSSYWRTPYEHWVTAPDWTPSTGEPWGTSRSSQWSGAPLPREHLPGNASWSSSSGSYQQGSGTKDDNKSWQWR
jgi:hypothetical protein